MTLNHCYQGDCRAAIRDWPAAIADLKYMALQAERARQPGLVLESAACNQLSSSCQPAKLLFLSFSYVHFVPQVEQINDTLVTAAFPMGLNFSLPVSTRASCPRSPRLSVTIELQALHFAMAVSQERN